MNRYLTKTGIMFVTFVASSLMLSSCKSKMAVVKAEKKETSLSVNKIIENHYNNKTEFSTLYIKASVQYLSEKQNQNITTEIKIKKDEQILISIRFLGITMAKVSITPTTVSYYEKMKGSYYDGDFIALSQLLGTDLDFNKIQNILLGRAIDDLKNGKYTNSLVDQAYRLDDTSDKNIKKSFYIDENSFLINRQEITQTSEERMLQIIYSNRKEFYEMVLPLVTTINTYQKSGKTEINLEYNTISFNEELSFPYSIPNDYTRIIIK